MDHVLRGKDEAHILADRHMQFVDLALAAGMLDLPHPLLADDIEFEIRCRGRFVQPDVDLGAPGKQHEKGEERARRPGDLDDPALGLRPAARHRIAAAIPDAKHPDQAEDEKEDRGADDQLGNEQRVDALAAQRTGSRPKRDPAHQARS